MKRFLKNNIQGFTLLETLLSVAIMVIMSTMLLNGFAATMGYSYHTSVYTKSAASNYSASMTTLFGLHAKTTGYVSNTPVPNNYYYAGLDYLGKSGSLYPTATKTPITISFDGTYATNATGVTLNSIKGVEYAYTGLAGDINVTGTIENQSVAGNRRTFFFIPTVNYNTGVSIDSVSNPLTEAYLGHIGIYKLNKANFAGLTNTAGQYVWGYMTKPGDTTTFVPVGTPFDW